jgi:hypothetical protein
VDARISSQNGGWVLGGEGGRYNELKKTREWRHEEEEKDR